MMRVQDKIEGGAYLLVIRLSRTARVRFGALGAVRLERGHYAYAGRASRGLKARLDRYLAIAGTKTHRFRLRWHIDYLLAHRSASITDLRLVSDEPELECLGARMTARFPGAGFVPGRIGASDCRHGCPSHLVRLGEILPGFGRTIRFMDNG
jgi:Uri superfamily endonuclease